MSNVVQAETEETCYFGMGLESSHYYFIYYLDGFGVFSLLLYLLFGWVWSIPMF